MKYLVLFSFSVFLLSCTTFVRSDGSTYKQFMPSRDRYSPDNVDTSNFIKAPFLQVDYYNKDSYKNGKKSIQPIRPEDISIFIESGKLLYIYLWDSHCPQSLVDIKKLDSISRSGKPVMVISLRFNYNQITEKLKNTVFANYPIYTISEDAKSNILLQRKAQFIKGICTTCYQQYGDEVHYADYLVINNGKVKAVYYNSENNMLK